MAIRNRHQNLSTPVQIPHVQMLPVQQNVPSQAWPSQEQHAGGFAPRSLTPAQLRAAFEGTKDADTSIISGRFPKIQSAGVHMIETQNVKVVSSTKFVGTYYIVEFTVLKTTIPEHVIEGNTYSWSHNLSHPIFGKANMKQYLAAIQGYAPGSPEEAAISDQDGLDSIGEDQPCKNTQCWLETSLTEKGFTRHRFWACD